MTIKPKQPQPKPTPIDPALLATKTLQKLSLELESTMVPKLRISLGSVVLDNAMSRSMESSARAKADFGAAGRLLQAYEEAGGKLR